MKGRVYDPSIRRFLTDDPIVAAPDFSQAWNPYSYVWNSPLNLIDPTGFQPCGAWVSQDGGPWNWAPVPGGCPDAGVKVSDGLSSEQMNAWMRGFAWPHGLAWNHEQANKHINDLEELRRKALEARERARGPGIEAEYHGGTLISREFGPYRGIEDIPVVPNGPFGVRELRPEDDPALQEGESRIESDGAGGAPGVLTSVLKGLDPRNRTIVVSVMAEGCVGYIYNVCAGVAPYVSTTGEVDLVVKVGAKTEFADVLPDKMSSSGVGVNIDFGPANMPDEPAANVMSGWETEVGLGVKGWGVGYSFNPATPHPSNGYGIGFGKTDGTINVSGGTWYKFTLNDTVNRALRWTGMQGCTWPHESGHMWEALSPHPSYGL